MKNFFLLYSACLSVLFTGCGGLPESLLTIDDAENFLTAHDIKLTLKESTKLPFAEEAFSYRANGSTLLKIARCSSSRTAIEFQEGLAKHDTENSYFVVKNNLLLILGNGPEDARKKVLAILSAFAEKKDP